MPTPWCRDQLHYLSRGFTECSRTLCMDLLNVEVRAINMSYISQSLTLNDAERWTGVAPHVDCLLELPSPSSPIECNKIGYAFDHGIQLRLG